MVRSTNPEWRRFFIATSVAWAMLFAAGTSAFAQTRVTGIDVSFYQGVLSQSNWNTIKNADGKAFTFIRSTRGGTTGTYDPSIASVDTLARRYDDPYFVQNITYATNAGLFAGPYHFGRMDIIENSETGQIANTGKDEAEHFLQMAGPWMRPGYLLPVFDFEAGSGIRTPSELAKFAIEFSDTIYSAKGIRPAVYIGSNYAQPMNNIPESADIVAAYPTLWNPRWPNQSNPGAIDIQNLHPGSSSSSVYGPWDNPPNEAHPWDFWQYASTGRLQGIGNNTIDVDLDVAHGGMEFLKDQLVPAIWLPKASGDWSTLTSWNSGQPAVAPVTPADQPTPILPATTPGVLPIARLPGTNDTVILDKGTDNVTITLSTGTQNIRKLYVREQLKITGGTLNVGYVPSADSTPIAAEFASNVTLSGGALNVHTLQVNESRTFSVDGGTLSFSKTKLGPDHSSPGMIAVGGTVNFSPLQNVTATIESQGGTISSGRVDLTNGERTFNIADGSADVDLAISVPVINGSLIKTGLGTLALNAANTYTGKTEVQSGTLRLGSASLGDSSGVYLSTGSLLNLNFTGSPDYVKAFYINGAAQANGIWGAIGSGAPNQTSFITGTGRLNVSVGSAPPLFPPPGSFIDDFEVNEGHFGWAYNNPQASQTTGLAASTTIDRVTTEHQGAGEGSQLLNLVANGAGAWTLRHNSGIGANLAGEPLGNVSIDAEGYVGFWLKTDDPGITVRIGIDDPVNGNTALERGFAQSIIYDNQWHLYQWNLENATHWDAFNGGADGDIDAPTGEVTIDSIWFTGSGNAQIYLDNVSHNPLGMPAAASVAGDYNGDGAVTPADYDVWRSLQGNPVTPGSKADGNINGVVDTGDYITWRKLVAAASGSSISGASVPEPAAILLALVGVAFIATRRTTLTV